MTYYDDFDDYDRYVDLQGEYESDLIEKAISDLPLERVQWHLGSYGDAVQKRINLCLEESSQLLQLSYFGPALLKAFTTCELIVRHLILRPIVYGAILSDEWVEVLADRITTGPGFDYRGIFHKTTSVWGIDLDMIRLNSGQVMWSYLKSEIRKIRNEVVHNGSTCNSVIVEKCIECANLLLTKVVTPMAKRVGLSWPDSKAWNHVKKGCGGAKFTCTYNCLDPF